MQQLFENDPAAKALQVNAMIIEGQVAKMTGDEIAAEYSRQKEEEATTSDPFYNQLLLTHKTLMKAHFAWVDYLVAVKDLGELVESIDPKVKLPLNAHGNMVDMSALTNSLLNLVRSMTTMRRVAFPTLTAFQDFKKLDHGFFLISHWILKEQRRQQQPPPAAAEDQVVDVD